MVAQVVAVLIVVGAFAILGWVLARSWREVPWDELSFDIVYLVLSFLFFGISFPTGTYAWRMILGYLGYRVAFKDALVVLALPLAGKYIPGKVWFSVGRMVLAKELGVPEQHTVVSIVIETAFLLGSSVVMFLLTLAFLPPNLPGNAYLPLIALPLCAVLVLPGVFSPVVNWFLRRWRMEEISWSITGVGMVKLLILFLIHWAVQGVGFYFLVRSFYPVDLGYLPVLCGIYALAWSLGFISLIAPGGLGIREGIMSFFLKMFFPLPVAVLIALIARVWTLVGETLFVVVVIFFLGRTRVWKKQEL